MAEDLTRPCHLRICGLSDGPEMCGAKVGEPCRLKRQPAPAPDHDDDLCTCGSDVTDMDGHTVHFEGCPEDWQSRAALAAMEGK